MQGCNQGKNVGITVVQKETDTVAYRWI